MLYTLTVDHFILSIGGWWVVVEGGNVRGNLSRGNVQIPLHVPAGSRSSRRRGRYSVHYDDSAAGAVAGDDSESKASHIPQDMFMSESLPPQSSLFPGLGTGSGYAGLHTLRQRLGYTHIDSTLIF